MSKKTISPRSIAQSREGNPNWRGGRLVASNGYMLIRVGTDHHLADIRGYAYEHRVVGEKKIGRRLKKGEMVHHKNGNKVDNRPGNLTVVANNAEHLLLHRLPNSRLRLPGERNPKIKCACGCGTLFRKFDESSRPRKFVSGHNTARNLQNKISAFLATHPNARLIEIARACDSSNGVACNAIRLFMNRGIVVRVCHGRYRRI